MTASKPGLATHESFVLAVALTTALRTGILAELAKSPIAEDQLVKRLGLDPRATRLLLDLLQTSQLVHRDGDQISAGEMLVEISQQPGGASLQFGMWAHAEEFVRTGEPFTAMDQSVGDREQAYRTVVGGLGSLFQQSARDLASRLPLHPRNILDVGCGSGVWSLALAERYPDARVTGLDLPAVLESFRARAVELALADRTHALPGDMHVAELVPGSFDLVIIANVLRLETPERAQRLVERVSRAVAPGGAVLVIDSLAEGTPDRDRARAVYAMHHGLRMRTGQVHRARAIAGWLEQVGFSNITDVDVANGTGGLGALLATQPGGQS